LTLIDRLIESSSPAAPATRDRPFGIGSGRQGPSWQAANGRFVERRVDRERRRVRGDGRPRDGHTRGLVPGETGCALGHPRNAAGTSRRGNPDTGPGRKAATVRRRGGPNDDTFGSRRAGPAVRANDHFGGQGTEKARSRAGELEPDRSRRRSHFGGCAGPGGAVASRPSGRFGVCEGAESTGSLLSEHSPPASV
jgi:hypothetical protein